jgi:hypothetical protein
MSQGAVSAGAEMSWLMGWVYVSKVKLLFLPVLMFSDLYLSGMP